MPIKPKRIFFTPYTPDADGICLAQQRVGAGVLVLNGASVSGGVASFGTAATEYQQVGYQVNLTSAGNLSAVNFTVTGTDPEGKALTETLAGPNANTVETAAYFKTVTSVSVSATIATDATVGTVDEFATAPIVLDLYTKDTGFAVDISGTIDYSVQKCFERLTAGEIANWVAGGLTAQTADGNASYTQSTGALRVIGNSYTATATVGLNVNQAIY